MTPTAPNRILVVFTKVCAVLSGVLIVGVIVAGICGAPQQEPSGSTPGVKSSASAREDTPSPLAAIKELVRTAAERVVQILSAVPINYGACGRAANDAAQAADKAIRQLKALPEGQVGQAQRESLERAFGTFARAMHLVSDGAAQRRPRTRAGTA